MMLLHQREAQPIVVETHTHKAGRQVGIILLRCLTSWTPAWLGMGWDGMRRDVRKKQDNQFQQNSLLLRLRRVSALSLSRKQSKQRRGNNIRQSKVVSLHMAAYATLQVRRHSTTFREARELGWQGQETETVSALLCCCCCCCHPAGVRALCSKQLYLFASYQLASQVASHHQGSQRAS